MKILLKLLAYIISGILGIICLLMILKVWNFCNLHIFTMYLPARGEEDFVPRSIGFVYICFPAFFLLGMWCCKKYREGSISLTGIFSGAFLGAFLNVAVISTGPHLVAYVFDLEASDLLNCIIYFFFALMPLTVFMSILFVHRIRTKIYP